MSEIIRLPEWKACLDDMIKDGLEYNKVYAAEFFEERLRVKRDEMKFGLDISRIRRELEKLGFYLTGRGQKQTQFVILPPAANSNIMCAYQREALDALTRGVILGTNTRMDMLTAGEKLRHEQVLERMAIKTALMGRSKQIHAAIKKHAPKLLK